MATAILVTGDDIILPTTLTKTTAKTTFVIDLTAIITARLVTSDRESVLTNTIPQVTSQPGVDLANSLIVIKFASADTISVREQGGALLEIQVDDGGKLTWFIPVKIVRGQIA